MPTNVEIKARVADLPQLRRRTEAIADRGPITLRQTDTFFETTSGRLKLRELDSGEAELIYYERGDSTGPARSSYWRADASAPAELGEVLRHCHGLRGIVRKERTLYLVGQTRVHLDRVEDLGDFVELEVVLEPGQAVERGTKIARELMETLGIDPDELVDVAYIDLLAPPSREAPDGSRRVDR